MNNFKTQTFDFNSANDGFTVELVVETACFFLEANPLSQPGAAIFALTKFLIQRFHVSRVCVECAEISAHLRHPIAAMGIQSSFAEFLDGPNGANNKKLLKNVVLFTGIPHLLLPGPMARRPGAQLLPPCTHPGGWRMPGQGCGESRWPGERSLPSCVHLGKFLAA